MARFSSCVECESIQTHKPVQPARVAAKPVLIETPDLASALSRRYHCMLSGLGLGGGDVAAARVLRSELADWVVENGGRVLGGLTVAQWVHAEYKEAVEVYARRIKNGRYGGALEMKAFSLKYKVPVELYEQTSFGLIHLWETSPGNVQGAEALRLLYRSKIHFDRVELA